MAGIVMAVRTAYGMYAKNDFINSLKSLENGLFNSINGNFTNNDIDSIVDNYLNSNSSISYG